MSETAKADELVERLRKYGARFGVPPLCVEAADELEQLRAQLAAAEAKLDVYEGRLLTARNECSAAETKLASDVVGTPTPTKPT